MRSEVHSQIIDDGVHLDLAEDILKGLFKDDMESASRRVSCSNFNDHGDVEEDKKVLCQSWDGYTSRRRWTMTRSER